MLKSNKKGFGPEAWVGGGLHPVTPRPCGVDNGISMREPVWGQISNREEPWWRGNITVNSTQILATMDAIIRPLGMSDGTEQAPLVSIFDDTHAIGTLELFFHVRFFSFFPTSLRTVTMQHTLIHFLYTVGRIIASKEQQALLLVVTAPHHHPPPPLHPSIPPPHHSFKNSPSQ